MSHANAPLTRKAAGGCVSGSTQAAGSVTSPMRPGSPGRLWASGTPDGWPRARTVWSIGPLDPFGHRSRPRPRLRT